MDYNNYLTEHLATGATWRMDEDDLLPMLQELDKTVRLVSAVAQEVATRAEECSLPAKYACKDLAALLQKTLNLTGREARRRARVSHEISGLPETEKALRAGEISNDHVLIISNTIRKVPVELREGAEALLADRARTLTDVDLGKAGKYLLSRVNQDEVLREEKDAVASRSLKITQDEQGRTVFSGCLDPEAGAMLTTAVDALSKPLGADDDRSADRRRADGLVEILKRSLDGGNLPTVRGECPHLVVTMDFADLRDGVGSGMLDRGGPITAATVRRMACDALIIPIILGTDGAPLDVGRAARTFPPHLRRALVARDQGCAFPGRDRPPAWTEAHHVIAVRHEALDFPSGGVRPPTLNCHSSSVKLRAA